MSLGPAAFLLLTVPLSASGQTQEIVPDIGIEQRLDEQVPLELAFRDERGNSVALRDYFGARPVILVMAYFCCPRICSLVLSNLTDSLRRLDYDAGKHFTVVVVSIDPRETPELAAAKKAACLELYGRPGSEDGWHFLTGAAPAINELARTVGFRYFYDPQRDQYAHASGIMLLTPTGKLARYFFGLEYQPRDLRFGLEDAAAGKAGLPAPAPLRLLCFAYDPETGKYTLLSMRLVRWGGLVTVAMIGMYFGRCWQRGKTTK